MSSRKQIHYAAPRQRDLELAAAGDADQVQAIKLQRRKDEMLVQHMEMLADALCKQFLDANQSGLYASAVTTPILNSRAPPAVAVPVAPLNEIRQQVRNMQLHIQSSLLYAPPSDDAGGDVRMTTVIPTQQDVRQPQAPQYVSSAAPAVAHRVPKPPPAALLGVSATQGTNVVGRGQQPQSMQSRPLRSLVQTTTKRDSNDVTLIQTAHQMLANAAPLDVITPPTDVFDLPYAMRHAESTTTGVPSSSTAHMPQPSPRRTRGPPSMDYDDTQPPIEVAFVPNHHAVCSMVGEAHGLTVGHIQPVISASHAAAPLSTPVTYGSPRHLFRSWDRSIDGNTRCLSTRAPPKLSSVEIALRSLPEVLPPLPSPRELFIQRTIERETAAINALKQKEEARAAEEAAMYSSTRRRQAANGWSPRDQATKGSLRGTKWLGSVLK